MRHSAAVQPAIVRLHVARCIGHSTACAVALPEHVASRFVDTVDGILLGALVHVCHICGLSRLADTRLCLARQQHDRSTGSCLVVRDVRRVADGSDDGQCAWRCRQRKILGGQS